MKRLNLNIEWDYRLTKDEKELEVYIDAELLTIIPLNKLSDEALEVLFKTEEEDELTEQDWIEIEEDRKDHERRDEGRLI